MILLFLCVFIAGFIDSIAGGGGLITIPAYYAFGLSPHMALGTNKFSSSMAALLSSFRYIKGNSIVFAVAIPTSIASLIFSVMGAKTALFLSEAYLKYILIFAIPIIAGVVLFKKDFGKEKDIQLSKTKTIAISLLIGSAIGFYDGFFGPGTGTFYIIAFTTFLGMDIKSCCGTARIANLASNIAALITFILNGKVLFAIALPCAVFSMMGSWVGTGLALKGGVKVVKPALVVIMCILMGKMIYETFLI